MGSPDRAQEEYGRLELSVARVKDERDEASAERDRANADRDQVKAALERVDRLIVDAALERDRASARACTRRIPRVPPPSARAASLPCQTKALPLRQPSCVVLMTTLCPAARVCVVACSRRHRATDDAAMGFMSNGVKQDQL